MKRRLFFILAVLAPLILSAIFIFAGHPDENGRISLTGETTSTPDGYEELIKESQIVLANSAKDALITINGKDEIVKDLQTVESVDSTMAIDCPVGAECGQGWYVPTDSPSAFRNATNGQCVDTDGYYGSQCWDLGNLFWQNYTGRSFSTCGKGGAKNTIENGCWQINAGSEFTMIWDKTQIQAGDWVITNGGQYGHVGMAVGSYNNGYVALFGTNQGGAACSGGGAVANTINMGLSQFAGAFRPKSWHITPSPDPTPTPTPEPSATSYTVRKGDTLGEIAIKNGWFKSGKLFGDDGLAQQIANRNGILNRGLIFPGQVINWP